MVKMKQACWATILTALAALIVAPAAFGDIDVYSDGSDLDLTVGAGQTVVIDLGGAETGNWDDPSPVPGSGIFDPEKWAVVFKYTHVDVQSGGTLKFTNHPSGAPVVWLVQGPVTINGTVDLNGQRGHNYNEIRWYSEPGPGGFRGGRASETGSAGSAGFGPGGARLGDSDSGGSGGGYGTDGTVGGLGGGAGGGAYGNPLLLPLIGGSGGSGGTHPTNVSGGGAGGGAILIASATTILVNGLIRANGGTTGSAQDGNGRNGGAGSGGAIRLIGDTVSGVGSLRAAPGGASGYGGAGGVGRIRVEANSITLSDSGSPVYTTGLPGSPVKIWPDEFTPIIRVVSIAGQPVSLTPRHGLVFPNQEVFMSEAAAVPMVIEAYNVPPAATMTVRVIPKSGADAAYTATLVDETAGLWEVDVQIPDEISAIQVRAVLP